MQVMESTKITKITKMLKRDYNSEYTKNYTKKIT